MAGLSPFEIMRAVYDQNNSDALIHFRHFIVKTVRTLSNRSDDFCESATRRSRRVQKSRPLLPGLKLRISPIISIRHAASPGQGKLDGNQSYQRQKSHRNSRQNDDSSQRNVRHLYTQMRKSLCVKMLPRLSGGCAHSPGEPPPNN